MKKRWNQLCIPYIAVCLLTALLAGCGLKPPSPAEEQNNRLNVVTTLFPYYDFTRQIAGDRVNLSMVLPAGMDSHSYEPTPADMRVIQNADVLICNGGEMEHWLSQVLEAVDTSSMIIVRGMDRVTAVREEIVEGMEDEAHAHDEGADGGQAERTAEADFDRGMKPAEDDGHEVIIEYDEHIWTSPVNAMALTEVVGDTLILADPSNEVFYRENRNSYLEKLKALDDQFCQVMTHKKRDMIIIGDKFPFRYLADAYGLKYRAAFSGCSTDTEPSAKTIAYLIDKVKGEGIPVVFYLELSSHRVSEIIAEETGAELLLLHSCHNVTRQEFDGGVTYLSLMEQNVRNLRKGLDE